MGMYLQEAYLQDTAVSQKTLECEELDSASCNKYGNIESSERERSRDTNNNNSDQERKYHEITSEKDKDQGTATQEKKKSDSKLSVENERPKKQMSSLGEACTPKK